MALRSTGASGDPRPALSPSVDARRVPEPRLLMAVSFAMEKANDINGRKTSHCGRAEGCPTPGWYARTAACWTATRQVPRDLRLPLMN